MKITIYYCLIALILFISYRAIKEFWKKDKKLFCVPFVILIGIILLLFV